MVEKPVVPRPVVEKPKTKGTLILYSQPSGARVFVDNQDTGRTTPIHPSKPLELSAGSHRVTFVLGDIRYNHAVVVQAGKAKNLSVTLSK
jgi:hypothetical protein